MPDPQTLKSGQDVTALMSGADVTDLMTGAPSAAPVPATDVPAWKRVLGGVWSQVNPLGMLTGLAQVATDPIGVAKGQIAPMAEQAMKSYENAKLGRYSEAAGHGLAAALPIIGPQAAAIGETIGTGEPGNVAYGAGQALGLVGGMLAPSAAKSATEAAVARGYTLPKMGALAAAAERGSTARIVDVIAPKGQSAAKIRAGNQAQRLAPQLAREEGMGALSRQALAEKVRAKLDEAGEGLDEAAAKRTPGQLYDTSPIKAGLQEQLRALTAESAAGPEAHAQVDAMGLTSLPASAPSGDLAFADLPRAYKQELRRMKVELEEVGYQKPDYLHQRSGRSMMNASDAEKDAELNAERKFQPARAGAPVYHEIQADKSGTSRAAVIRALDSYINGKSASPVVQRAIGVADRRLRGESTSAIMPPDAGFATEDVAGPLGKDVIPEPNQTQAQVIQRALAELDAIGPAASFETLRRLRASYDDVAKARYNPMAADAAAQQSKAKGAANVTRVFRDFVAQTEPETSAANQNYALWSRADEILRMTEETERARPKTGSRILARGFGAVTGERAGGLKGAVIGYALAPILDGALQSGVTTKIATARLLAQVSDALKTGDTAKATALIKKAAALTRTSTVVNAALANADREQEQK